MMRATIDCVQFNTTDAQHREQGVVDSFVFLSCEETARNARLVRDNHKGESEATETLESFRRPLAKHKIFRPRHVTRVHVDNTVPV